MARGTGQITRNSIGQEQQGTYGDDFSINYFLLFVPLQTREWCALENADVLQRFALHRRISVNSGNILQQWFQIGHFSSFIDFDTGAIANTSYQLEDYQRFYPNTNSHFHKLGLPPIKTLPYWIEAKMMCKVSANSSAKVWNVDFCSQHDDDFSITYDGLYIPTDLSTRDLNSYDMPMSTFLIRDILVKSYNTLMHQTNANYSYMLFGSV